MGIKYDFSRLFSGIVENLSALPQYYPGWTMRLYYDLSPGDPLLTDLCSLACRSPSLDLCYVRELPGTPLQDASKVFAMNWRFFPTLDPQVGAGTYLSGRRKKRIFAVDPWPLTSAKK